MKDVAPRYKKKWGRRGVSEIIGTLLILGITVALFSTLFVFIYSLQGPTGETYTKMSSQMDVVESNATITITHEGGESLYELDIQIIIYIDGVPNVKLMSDSTYEDALGLMWEVGESWQYKIGPADGFSPACEVSVWIIDTDRNSVVWQGNLVISDLNYRPNILQRYVSPSVVVQNEYFTVSAIVTDPDTDIWRVNVDLTPIHDSFSTNESLTDPDGDSQYMATFHCPADANWGLHALKITARDYDWNTRSAYVWLTVVNFTEHDPVIEFETIQPYIERVGNVTPVVYSIWESTVMTVQATVTDPDGNLDPTNVSVDATSLGLGILPLTEVGENVYSTSEFEPTSPVGDYTVTIMANDTTMHNSTKDLVVSLVNASAPVVAWATCEPSNVLVNGTFYVRARVLDQDDDVTGVTVDLTPLGGGVVNLSGPMGMFTDVYYGGPYYANSSISTVYLPVEATDSLGRTDSLDAMLWIVAGTEERAPFIADISFDDSSIAPGDAFTLMATVIDINGNLDIGTVRLNQVSIGGEAYTAYGSRIGDMFQWSCTAPANSGYYVLTVYANDTAGNSAMSDVILVVIDDIPTKQWAVCEPTTVLLDDAFTVKANVVDPDGDFLYVNVSGGGLGAVPTNMNRIGTSDVFQLAGVDTTGWTTGEHVFTVQAIDADGKVADPITTRVRVVFYDDTDAPPIISETLMSPNPADVGETVTVYATVVDINGNLNPAGIVVYPSGDQASAISMSPFVGSVFRTTITAPTSSGFFTYTINASDYNSNYAEADLILQVIGVRPNITWAVVQPTSVLNRSSFNVRAGVTDPNNDINSVWVNLSLVGGPDNVTLTYKSQGVYESGLYAVSQLFNVSAGDYDLPVGAIDLQGNLAPEVTGRIRVLTNETVNSPPIIAQSYTIPDPVISNGTFKIRARIFDVDGNMNQSSLHVNLSNAPALAALNGNIASLTLMPNSTDFYETGNLTAPFLAHTIDEQDYAVRIVASDDISTPTQGDLVIRVVQPDALPDKPDLFVRDISFSKLEPVHGEIVVITADIENKGGQAAMNFYVAFYDGDKFIDDDNISVPSGDYRGAVVTWTTPSGGNHTITVVADYLQNVIEYNEINNNLSKNITVQPTILLVDDDHTTNDGSALDVIDRMETALRSGGFDYDMYVVTLIDGPRYSEGTIKLMDYDIVVWMTGYQSTNILTAQDRTELDKFLKAGGSLWMISEGALNDPSFEGWSHSHATLDDATKDTGPKDPLDGVEDHPITGSFYDANYSINVTDSSRGDYISSTDGDEMFVDNTTLVNAVSYSYNNSATNISRYVFFSFEFSEIRDRDDQALLAYRVIMWLSNISGRAGRDVSISDQGFSTLAPSYRDTVTITAWARNNGGDEEKGVEISLFLDGVNMAGDENNELYTGDNLFRQVNIPGNGGSVFVEFKWWADVTPGSHDISIKIDPDNQIPETNEANNEVSGKSVIKDIYIRFGILLVDDDGSANNENASSLANVTSNMTETLEHLGYSYTLHVVPGNGSGPSSTSLRSYNAVIWMTGETDTDTLTEDDQSSLMTYLETDAGCLWLIGQSILDDLDTTTEGRAFIDNVLHVESWISDAGTPATLFGERYNDISHGVKYRLDDTLFTSDGGDAISFNTSSGETYGITWQDSQRTRYNGLMHNNMSKGYQMVFMPYEYAFIIGLSDRPYTPGTRTDEGTRANIWSDTFVGGLAVPPWTEEYDPTGKAIGDNDGSGQDDAWDCGFKNVRNGAVNGGYIRKAVDMSGYISGNITFYHKTTVAVTGAAHIYLDVYDGTAWQLGVFDVNCGATHAWTQAFYNIPVVYLGSTFQFRFRMDGFETGNFADGTRDFSYLDNVLVQGEPAAAPGAPDVTNLVLSNSVVEYYGFDNPIQLQATVNDNNTAVLYVNWTIDAFPVSGIGTGMTFTDASDPNIFPAFGTITTTDLLGYGLGNHIVYARASSDGTNWGGMSQRTIRIVEEQPTAAGLTVVPNPAFEVPTVALTAWINDTYSNITDAEWYWDGEDLGPGNNNPLDPVDGLFDSGNEQVQNLSIDLLDRPLGANIIWVRGNDTNGYWNVTGTSIALIIQGDLPVTTNLTAEPSPTNEARFVYVNATIMDNSSNIDLAEYYLDTYPTNYNGTAALLGNVLVAHVSTAPLGDSNYENVTVTLDVVALGLTTAVHNVYVHGRDVTGKWGPLVSVPFLVSSTPPIVSSVTVTPDPTAGATQVSVTANVTDSESTISEAQASIDDITFATPTALVVDPHTDPPAPPNPIQVYGNVPLPLGLTLGEHTMYVRARQSSDNRWSLPASTLFTVSIIDDTPPSVVKIVLTPNPTAGNNTVLLEARVTDPYSQIQYAEYYIGQAGQVGTGIPMNASDGAFDTKDEWVWAELNVTDWNFGEYTISVRGRDIGDSNQWSESASELLMVSKPSVEETLATRSEFAFMVMRWFDHPEPRPEPRTVSIDIDVRSAGQTRVSNPMVGIGYTLQTDIYNYGDDYASLMVTFYDEDAIIETKNIFVEANARHTAQVTWTPQFVGSRQLAVYVTPLGDEVFDFNNGAYVTTNVYFFYDDMENGAGNWEHDSTIMSINGESALEFMDPPINTTVVTNWNRTVGFAKTTDTYHTKDSCYWAEEIYKVVYAPADVIISFAIDDSKSMQQRYSTSDPTKSWLDVAKDSAEELLDQISDDSVVVSIWDFNGNMERRWFGPDDVPITSTRYTTEIVAPAVRLGDDYGGIDGREYIRNQITTMMNPPGQTILWDAVGGAYEDVLAYSSRPEYAHLTPVVVVLSDGSDTQASDESPLGRQKVEAGSAFWAPWSNMSDGTLVFAEHRGKYTRDWTMPETSTEWLRALTYGGSIDLDRIGLLGSDIRMYTIGLGLEHHDPPYEPEIGVWPGEFTIDMVNATCTDPVCIESGTLEYNLWRMANTSSAEYYYAETADDLGQVFGQIAQQLASLVTRSGEGTDATRAVTEKYAITETFSLEDVSEARLTFYHKYDLKLGYNGGLVMIGESADGVNWVYNYTIPPTGYSGNLYLGAEEYDDGGNLMMWCWNGVSGSGTFAWEDAEIDLSAYIGKQYVRVKFMYFEYDGGGGGGWWIDDVKVKVTRDDDTAVTANTTDQWKLAEGIAWAYSGSACWSNINESGYFKGGIDNSLYTTPIDLTNAKYATLSAMLKFNINTSEGRPPDCFRVEASKDDGRTWNTLTFGVRACWGIAGSETDIGDGVLDGKSYTGIDDNGDGWVNANTLTRLRVDLTGWRGSLVILRFRMVTASDDNPYFGDSHYQGATPAPGTGAGGFWLDDVIVSGTSLGG